MSIFDTNIKHPLEVLLDNLEEIVGGVVSQELCHYNVNPGHLIAQICFEIRKKGFWFSLIHSETIISNWSVWKVECTKAGYRRNIPFYKFCIYCVERDNLDNEYLFELCAGVSGIIHECI